MKKSFLVTASTISMAVFAASPVLSADLGDSANQLGALPAVSGTNWKLGIAGGLIDLKNEKTDGRVHGEASVSIPLTFSTGLQVDGSIGDVAGDTTGSIGTHLFYRDPSSLLVGAWGSYAAIGSNDIGRIGPEAELYFDNITLQGTVGWEDSDSHGNDVFVFANLALYPSENVKVYLGYRRTLERDAAAAGFEWLTDGALGLGTPMSVFAEGQVGDDDHSTVWAGLRFYFGGPDKSLVRRHREDDPSDPTTGLNQLAGQLAGQSIPFVSPDGEF